MFDLLGNIDAYEAGELDSDGVVDLFQHLVDTGLAWVFQGHYGRMAARLLKSPCRMHPWQLSDSPSDP